MTDNPELKTVELPNGLVRFPVPEHWVAEFDETGEGCCFDPADEAVTLRVNVLTVEPPANRAFANASDALRSMPDLSNLAIEELSDGSALVALPEVRSWERGKMIEISTWAICRLTRRTRSSEAPSATTRVHLAFFALTLVPHLSDPSRLDRARELVRACVRQAVVSEVPY